MIGAYGRNLMSGDHSTFGGRDRKRSCELGAGRDVKLPVGPAQVVLDRSGGEEETFGDLAIAHPFCDELCHPALGRGQGISARELEAPRLGAGQPKLLGRNPRNSGPARPLCEVNRRAQVLSGLAALARAAKRGA